MRSSALHRRGFSLIEFTAVLALMALLAGIVSYSVHHVMISGRQNAARAQIKNMQSAVDDFYTRHKRYPSNDEGLAALTQKDETGTAPMATIPLDPWDHPYEYLSPGERGGPYAIICRGADGRRGGDGADADITSEDLRAK